MRQVILQLGSLLFHFVHNRKLKKCKYSNTTLSESADKITFLKLCKIKHANGFISNLLILKMLKAMNAKFNKNMVTTFIENDQSSYRPAYMAESVIL